ncbi:MAG: Iron-sulfur cluster assembly ATPase protein SufC [Candidatus Saccharicenans subterraneus]|uniref:Iron-sulfur cluster assembly ATPase protein SufC n=1 Tax=Candidatus Saccharicenans subterraneus TaxID=2508984 RepID=A0A3E2BQW8_9BACT|nr:MAG: Iron-sulfur cluster assembly ATPase protein SufC [Candidatus Saccharicenans subterraneum]
MTILELKDVSFTANSTGILNGLTMEIWEGYVHAVVGPNGAGKSTLANVIMGLPDYRRHEGDILFEGKSIKPLNVDERARLGITLAWQEPARFEGLKVSQFILASAREKNKDEVDRALELVGLEPVRYRNRAVDKTLSGGERKRIELASILAMKPRLVMLDEPDSGVDIEAIERIFEAIAHLKEEGTTVLLITHSARVLEKADHAFLLCSGMLVDKGETAKILEYFSGKCLPCPHKNVPDLNSGRKTGGENA